MNKKKTIAVAIVLALILLIGGMLAYFTDTDSATNTFTIGNVDISLTEPLWDALDDEDNNNIPDVAESITPGATIDKDPTINNISTTNGAYVFAKVVVPALDATTPLFTYETNTGWAELGTAKYDATAKTITHVYAYGSASAMTELEKATSATAPTSTSSAVFSSVTLGNFTATQLSGITTTQIVVSAYGIQKDNLSVSAPTDIAKLFDELKTHFE